MNAKEIAQTIVQQVKAFDPYAFMAWGAEKMQVIPAQGAVLGGLAFKMNGAKLKGYVRVSLMACDTYTLEFLDKRGVAVKELEDIYCDQLMHAIDSVIER
jgi:hypothetical protein